MRLKIFNRVLCCILSIIAIFIFVGCEDNSLEAQLERAKQSSKSAQEAYEQSKRNYDNMLDDLEDYQKSQNYLDSFK